MASRQKGRKRESETNFWPVYSDIAIVVVIIMLLFILAQLVVNTKLIASSSFEMLTNQIQLHEVFVDSAKPREGIVRIEEDGNLQLFTFSSDVLFRFDEADFRSITKGGRKLLREFGETLAKNQDLFTRIQIEGHASWEPWSGFDDRVYNDHNWNLSARRALAVGKAFIEAGVGPYKISVAGRSYYVPVEPGLTIKEANPRQPPTAPNENRRINVIIFYSQFGKDSKILR